MLECDRTAARNPALLDCPTGRGEVLPRRMEFEVVIGADVAQVSNLLYRRFPIGRPPDPVLLVITRGVCRLEALRDSGWKPALRLCPQPSRSPHSPHFILQIPADGVTNRAS